MAIKLCSYANEKHPLIKQYTIHTAYKWIERDFIFHFGVVYNVLHIEIYSRVYDRSVGRSFVYLLACLLARSLARALSGANQYIYTWTLYSFVSFISLIPLNSNSVVLLLILLFLLDFCSSFYVCDVRASIVVQYKILEVKMLESYIYDECGLHIYEIQIQNIGCVCV